MHHLMVSCLKSVCLKVEAVVILSCKEFQFLNFKAWRLKGRSRWSVFYEGILIGISSLVSSSHFFEVVSLRCWNLFFLILIRKKYQEGAAACTLAIMRLFPPYHDSILPQIVKTIVTRIVPWRKTRGISLFLSSLSLIVFPFFPRKKYCKKKYCQMHPPGNQIIPVWWSINPLPFPNFRFRFSLPLEIIWFFLSRTCFVSYSIQLSWSNPSFSLILANLITIPISYSLFTLCTLIQFMYTGTSEDLLWMGIDFLRLLCSHWFSFIP